MALFHQEVVDRILATPAPVLFIDTCIMLDVVRSPYRENVEADAARIFEALIQFSKITPPEVWLTTCETVESEWRNNIANVKAELEKEVLKLEQRTQRFWEAAKSANNILNIRELPKNTLKIEDTLESISESLLKRCLSIVPEDRDTLRAMQRVKKDLPPARRGKSEPKDCEIFEVFLRLSRALRNAGFKEKILLVSSNTSDYGGQNEAGIRQEIESINGKFIANISWAMAELREHS
jgi:hypothetical protein